MFSQTFEYALRAVVFLAERPNSRWTANQIAEAVQVPAGYLAKVMQILAKKEIVKSQRGLNGGFSLARNPDELTVYEVLTIVDPLPRIRQCPLNIESHKVNLCALHRKLDTSMEMVEQSLRDTKISELFAGEPIFPQA
ncbi:MAG: Rrf2 family transcriptional regulator [Candidatus Eisenbacteria bacterium]|uniref:Rrf2 family transcriptional regulator n=1 Tax=Eiseniibacteriota bacterium TaxID=2212470 RepID=A0A7Y2EC77_UNCEI|nr:Rrf2 family transcriptional regulator [Candidatus Eisenbacteria bacterium]